MSRVNTAAHKNEQTTVSLYS